MIVLFLLSLLFITGSAAVPDKGECEHDFECDMEMSVCVNGTCVCPPGYVRNSDMTKCLEGANGFGAKCVDSLQCSYSLKTGGYCSNGTCRCTEKYHYLRGRCWKTSGLNDTCHANENCFVNYDFESAVCNPDTNRCQCSEGYYQREYSSCRKISGPGGPCGIPLDCKNCPDAVCSRNRICQCSGSIKSVQHTPLQSSSGRNDRNEAVQNRISKGSVATLSHHHLMVRSAADPIIGENCTKTEDCSGLHNVDCRNGRCLCKVGFYTLDGKTECYPEIGSECSSDSDCIGKNMMCETERKWCTCKTGFVVAESNRMCEKLSRNISWSCLKLEECSMLGPGGICVRKKCSCLHSTHFIPEELYCWRTKKVGQACIDNRDCGYDSKVESCTKGVCMCAPGYHKSGEGYECRVDSKKVGDACGEDADCMFSNARCSNTTKTCICIQHYVEKEGACLGGVGSNCTTDGDCKAVTSSVCSNHKGGDGLCQCSGDDLVPSQDDSLCLPVANKFKDLCQEVQQCSKLLGEEGRCENNSCACSKGHHYILGHPCLVDVYLDGKCASSGECLTNSSYCYKGVCSCQMPLKPGHNHTTCISGADVLRQFTVFILVSVLFLVVIL